MHVVHPSKYLKFWSEAFALSAEALALDDLSLVNTGTYAEKHGDKLVFFFQDLISGKRVLASSSSNLEIIKKNLSEKDILSLDVKCIRTTAFFSDKELVFDDLDFYLESPSNLIPLETRHLDVRQLHEPISQLEDFYIDCSEQDKDTLDLNFENETVLAVFQNDVLAGIARYYAIRDTGIADITVLVRHSQRGKGLSTPLVSDLVKKIFKDGLQPKYRVAETNTPSIGIAKRLGFQPRARIMTWEV